MIIVVGGVSNSRPLQNVLDIPYRDVQILRSEPAKFYDLNKEMVENLLQDHSTRNILIGKSYGAWIVSETKGKSDAQLMISPPLYNPEGNLVFPKIARPTGCIYSSQDKYVEQKTFDRNKNKFVSYVDVGGNHSLEPHSTQRLNKVKEAITSFVDVVLEKNGGKKNGKKSKQSKRSIVHPLGALFSFLPRYEEFKVPISSQKEYKILDLNSLNIGIPNVFSFFSPINYIVQRKSNHEGLYIFQASISDSTKYNSLLLDGSATGGLGIDFDKDTALYGAIYESLERHSLSSAQFDIIKRSYADIPKSLQPPKEELIFYDESGLSKIVPWTTIQSIDDSSELLYPAQLISSSTYDFSFRETCSSGCALHSTKENALEKGLLEACERHMLMSWFYQVNKIESSKISINELCKTSTAEKILRSLQDEMSELHCYLLRMDGLHALFTVAQFKNGMVAVGSAVCEKDKLLEKSLKEIIVTADFGNHLREIVPIKKSDIKYLPQHMLYYVDERFPELVKYLDSISNDNIALEDNLDIEDIKIMLSKRGHKIFYKDVTAPELRPMNLVTIKVIVFGFLDLLKTHEKPWSMYHPLKNKKLPELPTPFA